MAEKSKAKKNNPFKEKAGLNDPSELKENDDEKEFEKIYQKNQADVD